MIIGLKKEKTQVNLNVATQAQWAEKVIRKKFWHICDTTQAIILVDHSNLKSTRDLYKNPSANIYLLYFV